LAGEIGSGDALSDAKDELAGVDNFPPKIVEVDFDVPFQFPLLPFPCLSQRHALEVVQYYVMNTPKI